MNHSQVLSPCLTSAGGRLKTWDVTPVQLHKKPWKRFLVNTDRCVRPPLSCTALVFHISLCHVHYPQLSLRCSQWGVIKVVVVRINGSHFYSLKIETRGSLVDNDSQTEGYKYQIGVPIWKSFAILKKCTHSCYCTGSCEHAAIVIW